MWQAFALSFILWYLTFGFICSSALWKKHFFTCWTPALDIQTSNSETICSWSQLSLQKVQAHTLLWVQDSLMNSNLLLFFTHRLFLWIFLIIWGVSNFQESSFAKQLVVFSTFPEREGTRSFKCYTFLQMTSLFMNTVASFIKNKTAYFIYVLVKSHNPLIRNLKLSYSNEDLKMKKLLLNLLVVMSRDSAALQVSHTLTQSLFKFG